MIAMRTYRKRLGLTQKQVADELGVTAPTVTQWESGERKPNIIMLKKLSIILKCSTDELLAPIQLDTYEAS